MHQRRLPLFKTKQSLDLARTCHSTKQKSLDLARACHPTKQNSPWTWHEPVTPQNKTVPGLGTNLSLHKTVPGFGTNLSLYKTKQSLARTCHSRKQNSPWTWHEPGTWHEPVTPGPSGQHKGLRQSRDTPILHTPTPTPPRKCVN